MEKVYFVPYTVQSEIVLSKVLFSELDELDLSRSGLVSMLPTISMKFNTKRRNTAFTFGFKLCRQSRAAKRNEQRWLVNSISVYEAEGGFTHLLDCLV